jgi:hypothetical protein
MTFIGKEGKNIAKNKIPASSGSDIDFTSKEEGLIEDYPAASCRESSP